MSVTVFIAHRISCSFRRSRALTRLIQAQLMPQLVFTDRIRMIDLIPQNEKRRLVQILHTKKCIQLHLALLESLWVLRIHEEYDPADFREVVFPQSARLLVAAEVEGGEAAAADAEFF